MSQLLNGLMIVERNRRRRRLVLLEAVGSSSGAQRGSSRSALIEEAEPRRASGSREREEMGQGTVLCSNRCIA